MNTRHKEIKALAKACRTGAAKDFFEDNGVKIEGINKAYNILIEEEVSRVIEALGNDEVFKEAIESNAAYNVIEGLEKALGCEGLYELIKIASVGKIVSTISDMVQVPQEKLC